MHKSGNTTNHKKSFKESSLLRLTINLLGIEITVNIHFKVYLLLTRQETILQCDKQQNHRSNEVAFNSSLQ